jgi:hypothetical protein
LAWGEEAGIGEEMRERIGGGRGSGWDIFTDLGFDLLRSKPRKRAAAASVDRPRGQLVPVIIDSSEKGIGEKLFYRIQRLLSKADPKN